MTVIIRKNLWRCDFCPNELEQDLCSNKWGSIEVIIRRNGSGEKFLEKHLCSDCVNKTIYIHKFIVGTSEMKGAIDEKN